MKWERIAREIEKCDVLCANCHMKRHPDCLTFHHRDGKTKCFQIADAVSGRFGIKAVLAEIAKCDVLCMNCHLKHHWEERQRERARKTT